MPRESTLSFNLMGPKYNKNLSNTNLKKNALFWGIKAKREEICLQYIVEFRFPLVE